MTGVAHEILSTALSGPEGAVLTPKLFLHLGSRAAIDQALSRLSRLGKLLRIARGLYVAPREGRFGERAPATETVIAAIEAIQGVSIVPPGAVEAAGFGLSTQHPIREVFLTSGRSKTLQLGSRRIELKSGKPWQLLFGRAPAGRAIRALSWLGPERQLPGIRAIQERLPEPEWAALCAARPRLPGWLAGQISTAMRNTAHAGVP